MTDQDCATTRERIPDYVRGHLPADETAAIEEHLGTCQECAVELELVRSLYVSRAEVPSGLAERVIDAVRSGRTSMHRPWWGLTAAAVAALAIGVGIVSDRTGPTSDLDVPAYAYEIDEGALWLSDDGLVAGAPSLEGLSDEALELLHDELAVGGAGGSA